LMGSNRAKWVGGKMEQKNNGLEYKIAKKVRVSKKSKLVGVTKSPVVF